MAVLVAVDTIAVAVVVTHAIGVAVLDAFRFVGDVGGGESGEVADAVIIASS